MLDSLAVGTKMAQRAVYVEGTSSIAPEDLRAAEELGYRVKLLGVAVRTAKGIEQRVHPTMVPKSSSIAQVMGVTRSEEHTSELQSHLNLVCRLLLEKKKTLFSTAESDLALRP